jgi:hypothetical protein
LENLLPLLEVLGGGQRVGRHPETFKKTRYNDAPGKKKITGGN